MKTMRALRSDDEVRRFLVELRKISAREYAVAVIGFTWGLRVGDILALRAKDILKLHHNKARIVDELRLIEQKTGKKSAPCVVTGEVNTALQLYFKGRRIGIDDSPLFVSRKKGPGGAPKPISRWQVCRNFKRAAEAAQLDTEEVGTHTMRKTFGRRMIEQGKPIEKVMLHLNHSSTVVTKKYLGITEDELRQDQEDMKWNIGTRIVQSRTVKEATHAPDHKIRRQRRQSRTGH